MTVTKRDLAQRVSELVELRESHAAEAGDALFTAMREGLINNGRIEIRGFGVFEVVPTKPKPAARNPKTGERVYVPARRRVRFKPGKLLKERLHKPIERGRRMV